MKIIAVEPESIAAELGIREGDELLEINGQRVRDDIDLRYHEADAEVSLKIAHQGEVTIYDIEKDEDDRIGLTLEEMRILSCGNDCIFCFVDQNPAGLRNQLYFRDGDYRLSFMYGNYTTMTNAGPAVLERIIQQRLSPQYISVHVTDLEIRRRLMGLKKDDHILEKVKLLHDHGIDMHTQIVLCPGINDGRALEKTVFDLYPFNRHIISLAVVPVGLTDHRFGLSDLRRVDKAYANDLLDFVERCQKKFRAETRRNFFYASDEFYIVAGRPIPPARLYDGFPQIENGVGFVRTFINSLRRQAHAFPERLRQPRTLTLITATLPEQIIRREVLSRLGKVGGLAVDLVVASNTLFGPSVTVAGLLSGKCVYSAMEGRKPGDLVLLPPDILNADGLMLDDTTIPQLEERLGAHVAVFEGQWADVFAALKRVGATAATERRA